MMVSPAVFYLCRDCATHALNYLQTDFLWDARSEAVRWAGEEAVTQELRSGWQQGRLALWR